MAKLVTLPAPAARLSRKLVHAIDLRIRKGFSIAEACKEAGLSTSGWHKAMRRPAVRDYLKEVQRQFIAEADTLKALARTRAYHVAMELLETTKNETIKCRLIEFLASDGKAPQVAVNVDARHGGGYEYVPPGSRVVEIAAAPKADERDDQ